MTLQIENIERLLPKRKHITLESVKINGKQVPIDEIEFKEEEEEE